MASFLQNINSKILLPLAGMIVAVAMFLQPDYDAGMLWMESQSWQYVDGVIIDVQVDSIAGTVSKYFATTRIVFDYIQPQTQQHAVLSYPEHIREIQYASSPIQNIREYKLTRFPLGKHMRIRYNQNTPTQSYVEDILRLRVVSFFFGSALLVASFIAFIVVLRKPS